MNARTRSDVDEGKKRIGDCRQSRINWFSGQEPSQYLEDFLLSVAKLMEIRYLRAKVLLDLWYPEFLIKFSVMIYRK